MSREAMRMALNALIDLNEQSRVQGLALPAEIDDAIAALRAALSEPKRCKYGDESCPCQDGDMCHYEGENPMTPPVPHRINNTQFSTNDKGDLYVGPPPRQEPVAWMHAKISDNVITHRPADIDRHPENWTPLYAVPPALSEEHQCEWRTAIDDAMVVAEIGIAEGDPKKCLKLLTDWHEGVGEYFALQKAAPPGYVMVPVDLLEQIAGDLHAAELVGNNINVTCEEVQDMLAAAKGGA